MTHPEQAVANFDTHLNCAQSVCAAFAEDFGLDREMALRVAAGFGGGMGRLADTCGVVSGAVIILGLKHGATEGADADAKAYTYEQVHAYVERFAEKHGAYTCRELLGCDISVPGGYEQAREQNLFRTRCVQLVRDAAEMLETML